MNIYLRVGGLRFQLPQPLPPYTGTHTASSFGPACLQQNVTRDFTFPSFLSPSTLELVGQVIGPPLDTSEDCESDEAFWYPMCS